MSGSDFPETWFASAERSAAEVLARQHGHFNDSLASALLDALPDPCALLNSHRQVVHANRAFLRLTGREHP
ncbi:MAG: PAS domain-containing protein, partial [Deltaproteobacteria bacterium]